MTPVVIDLETTIRGGKDHGSSPYWPENQLVAIGTYSNVGYKHWYYGSGGTTVLPDTVIWWWIEDSRTHKSGETALLIGHDIGFDLKWLLRAGAIKLEDLQRIRIWDTQQAEYLLSGQAHLYPSLDDCCKEIGLPLKDDKIKEYWKAGVDTFDIPKNELLDYLKQDVKNTWELYRYQMEIFRELPELLTLAQIKMEDILFTTLMEHHGMAFDLSKADEHRVDLERLVRELENQWSTEMTAVTLGKFIPEQWTPSITSGRDVGILLFGGEAKWEEEELTGEVFKTGARKGQPKSRKVERTQRIVPLSLVKAEANKTGWKTDDEVLQQVRDEDAPGSYAHTIASLVLNHRAFTKELSTYIAGYSRMVSPGDMMIHPSIHHCSTATGRQSCIKPNLQNVSGVEN